MRLIVHPQPRGASLVKTRPTKAEGEALDAAVNRFHASRIPGKSYMQTEIAEAIGVTVQAVEHIERVALAKIRIAHPELAEWMEDFPNSR